MSTFPLAAWYFSSPLMFWGLLLAVLPLIAHLLQKKVQHFHVFPSLRFFESSAQGYRNTDRLRRILLLALRLLAVFAVVMAFAWPQWFAADRHILPGEQGATVVVVDLSPSIGRETGGVSLLTDVKAAVNRALENARQENDLCNVILADSKPELLVPELSSNLSLLRQQVAQLSIRSRRAQPVSAVQAALQMLESHAGPRQLVLVSDYQLTNWPVPMLKNLPEGVQVTRVDLPEGSGENVAVSGVRVQPPDLRRGSPAVCSADLRNFGKNTAQVQLRAFISNRQVYTRMLEIPAGGRMNPSFDFIFEEEGFTELRFEIEWPEDGLSYDNKAWAALEVGARPVVVLVSDDVPDDAETAAYYISRALAPAGNADDPFDVQYVPLEQLMQPLPSSTRAVILCGPAALNEAAANTVLAHVAAGGNLILFAAHPSFSETAKRLRDLLPWQPAVLEQLSREQPAWLMPVAPGTPVMRHFTLEAQAAFETLPVYRRWQPEGEAASGSLNLLRFRDGLPALDLRSYPGGGQVLVLNASPVSEAGVLGSSGFFVALVQSIMAETAAEDRVQPRQVPGQTLTFAGGVPSGLKLDEVWVREPGGTRVFDAKFLYDEPRLTTRVADPREPGIYQLIGGGQMLAHAAVNPDDSESDLRSLPLSERDRFFDSGQQSKFLGGLRNGEQLLDPRMHPLWGWFLLAAIGFLFVENLLLARWRS